MASTTYGSPYVQSSDLVSAWPTASLSVADRIDDVSFKGNGLNNQTASYTGVLTDAGKTVMMNVATANTFTIPASGSIAYELGTVLRVSNKGAGTTTVQPNGGVTLNGGNISLTQYQSCEVQLVAADIWVATVKPAPTTVASGLTLITASTFSAVSSVSINSCFTATYANYQMMLTGYGSAGGYISMKYRLSGTDSSTDYYDQLTYSQTTSVGAERGSAKTAGSYVGYFNTSSTAPTGSSFDIYSPALAVATYGTGLISYGASQITAMNMSTFHNAATAYDGLTIAPPSGTITGTIRIFGYQNS